MIKITDIARPTRRLFINLALAAMLSSSCRSLGGIISTADITHQPATRHQQVLFWENYKRTFIRNLDNGSIIVDPLTNQALSEAMGHGLIFAAEREDWQTFNELLQGLSYFRKANGLFRWKINPDGTIFEDLNLASASESEQNVAYALLLAYEKTGQRPYLRAARSLLSAVYQNEVINFQGRLIFMPADRIGNRYWPINETTNELAWNPSYFSPHIYRKFVEYDSSHDWATIIQDGYYLLNEVLSHATRDSVGFGIGGINPVPAWVWLTPEGRNRINFRSYYPSATERTSNEWDSIRIPIYLAMDSPTPEAINFLRRFYACMQISGPNEAIIGQGRTGPSDRGYNNEMAIAAYAAGLNALGINVDSFIARLSIDRNGFITADRNSYYDQTICYYGWLLVENLFPR